MKIKKLISLILCIIISLIFFTGCDSDNDYVLYFELDSAPKTLDPQLVSQKSEEILVKNLFEGLMRENSKGEIVGGAASSYSVSKDGKTYTFTLRKDAKWSDGNTVKAEDFVFAFERAVDPKNQAPYVASLYNIVGAKAIAEGDNNCKLGVTSPDDNTVKIELISPDTSFLRTLTTSICMPCRKDVYNKAKGQYGIVNDRIVTNGSFKIRFWEKGEKFSFRINKFSDYNGDFTAEATAVIFNVGETRGRATRIEEGNLDMGFVSFSETGDKTNLFSFEKSCYSLIINRDSAFGSIDFRNAFAKSIHRNRLKNELGKSLRETSCLIPDTVQLNGTSLASQIKISSPPSYDPNEAHELYVSAAKNAENLPSKIDILYFGDDDIKNLALSVAENMQQSLGAVVNTVSAESESSLINLVSAGEYTLAILPITAKSNDPSQFFEAFTENSANNIYNFKSSEYDELVSKIKPSAKDEVVLSSSELALKELILDRTIIPIAMHFEAFSYGKEFTCHAISPFGGVVDLSLVRKNKQ